MKGFEQQQVYRDSCRLMMLAEKGCSMHPHKFVCQHWSKGFEFVGRHVKIDRVYVNNRILFRAEKRIHELNRCPRPEKVETFQQCLNSYIGQCKDLQRIRPHSGTTPNSMKTDCASRPCQDVDIENESKQSIT